MSRPDTGDDAHRPGPGLPSVGLVLLTVASAFAAVTFGLLAGMSPAPVAVSEVASAQLADDAGGAALFNATDLAPGQQVTRCLEVRYAGPEAIRDIRLTAADVDGALADDLRVTIQVGTGGGSGTCAGFTGQLAFDGPLRDLAAGPADAPGIATGWRPAGDGTRTYRITVTLAADSDRQLSASTATLRWVLPLQPEPSRPAGPAPSTPSATAPSTAPAAVPPAAVAPVPVAPSATVAPSAPSASPPVGDPMPQPGTAPAGAPAGPAPSSASAPPSTAAAAPGGPDAGDDADSAPARRRTGLAAATAQIAKGVDAALDVAGEILAVSGDVARRSAKHGALPGLSLFAAAGFLFIQHAIDRRDPKLALAPLWRDNYLHIADEAPEEAP